MRERPILFSAPMVRALLAGTKTQTRRVVKPQYDAASWSVRPALTPRHPQHSHDWWLPDATAPAAALPNCPYGQPGDRLWVRETWRPRGALSPWDMEVEYAADGASRTIRDGEFGERDWNMPKAAARGNVSPLFMPRWASRILLEVTEVRVERLQDISEADARAEGDLSAIYAHAPTNPRGAFSALWESINGARSWDANPWVWVIAFRPADQEGRSDG